jgi:hypothetical protein
VNDVPVAVGGSTDALEDIEHIIPLSAFKFSDVEGDSLQSITVTNLALAGGTLTHSGGTVVVSNGMTVTAAELADLTFLSAQDWFGNVSFDYAVNDSGAGAVSATLNIAVAPVNDAAIATGGATTVESDEPYNFQISDFGFTDPEGDSLQSITIESLDLQGGTLAFTDGRAVALGMRVDAADIGNLVFTPQGNTPENAVLRYTANDGVDDGIVVSEMVVRVVGPAVGGVIDLSSPSVVDEEAEEDEEVEVEEDLDDENIVVATSDVVEGTRSNPVVAAPPTLPQVVRGVEEQPVQIAEEIEEIVDLRETTPPPVRQTSVDLSNDTYQPIPLPNFTFEPVSRKAVLEEIDQSSQEIREYSEFLGTDVAKISFTFGSLLSIGGVSWLLRGGALMAAFLTAMPAWSRFDPVTIVTSQRDEKEEKESSEFDVMMEQVRGAQSQIKGVSQS